MTALASAFGLVFVAELGDKSMLLALTLATRYRWWWVLTAIAIETAVIMALAALAGGAADALLPDRAVAIGAGLLFLGFGAWTLLTRDDDPEAEQDGDDRSALLVIGTIAIAMFLSEIGDKTQLATVSLAGINPGAKVAVWLGATAGMVAGDAVAIFVGLRLHRALPQHLITIAAGWLFIAFGVGAIAFAFR